MFNSEIIMQYIEKIRIKQELTVSELTEGIKSTRNYTRYLNGEFDLPVDTFLLFLGRLKVQLQDFISYVYSDVEETEIQKYYFIDCVAKNLVDKAEKYYKYVINNRSDLETEFNLINISLIKYSYLIGKISKSSYVDNLFRFLDLDALVNSNIVTREEVEFLHMFIEVCNEVCKQKILTFFRKIIFEESVKIMSYDYYYTTLRIITGYIKIIIEHPEFCTKPNLLIKQLFNKALDIIKDYKTDGIYYDLLNTMISFFSKIGDQDRYHKAVFYYMAYQYSKLDVLDLNDDVIISNPDNQELYLRLLKDEDFLSKPFFEEMRFEDVK